MGYNTELNKYSYLRAMSGSMSEYGVDSYTIGQVNDNTISLEDNISNAVDYGKKATEGESHQDDKTWWQRTMDYIDNMKVSVREGFLNFFDAIGDAQMGVIGSIAQAVGDTNTADNMKKAINTDWQAGALRVLDISFDPFDPKTYKAETYDLRNVGNLEEDREYINNVRYGNTNDTFDSLTTKAGNVVGEAIPSIVTGGVIGSAAAAGSLSAGAAKAANISVQAALGTIQGAGSAYEKVAADDGDLAKGSIYAMSNGLINGAVSALSGAFGSKAMNMGETLGSKIAGKAFSGVASETAKKVLGKALSIAVDVGWDTATSVAQEAIDPYLRSVYDSQAVYDAYGTDENVKKTLDNLGQVALYSMASSVVRNSVSLVRDKATEYANKSSERASEKLRADADFMKNADRAQEIAAQGDAIVKRISDVENEIKTTTDETRLSELKAEKQTLQSKSDALVTEAKQIDSSMKEAYDTAVRTSKKEIRNEALGISNDTENTHQTLGVKKLIQDFEEKHPGRTAYSKIDDDLSYKVTTSDDDGGKRIMFKAKSNDGVVSAISYSQQNDNGGSEVSAMLRDLGGDTSALENGTQRVTISTDNNSQADLMAFKDTIQNPENYTKVFNTDDGQKHIVYYDSDTDTPFIELCMSKTDDGQKEYQGVVQRPGSFSDSLKNAMGNGNVANAMNLPSGQADTDAISKAIMSPILEQVRKVRGKGTVATIDFSAQEKEITTANDALYTAKITGKDMDVAIDRYITAIEKLDISTADLSESSPKEYRGTISDYLGDDPQQRAEFETNIRQAMKDVMDSVEIVPEEGNVKQNVAQAVEETSRKYKEIIIKNEAKYNSAKNRLNNIIKQTKLRRDAIIDLYRAERTLKKKYDTSRGLAKSGTWDIPQEMNQVFSNMAKTMTFTKSGKGLNPKSVEDIMNFEIQYDKKTAGMLPVMDEKGNIVSWEDQPGSVYSSDLDDAITTLRNTLVKDENGKWVVPMKDSDGNIMRDADGNIRHATSLSTEQTVLATNIYKMANKLTGKAASAERRAFKIKCDTAYRQASDVLTNLPGGFLKMVDRAGRNTQGFISQMSKLFGPASSAYDTVVRKPVQDWNNLTHLRSEEQQYVDSAMQRFGVKEKDLSGKVSVGDVEMPKSNAMHLYALSLSEDYELAKNVGVQYNVTKDSVKTIQIDDDFVNKVSSTLTDGEKGFVKEILENGYNGRMKQKMSAYTLKKTGVDLTEGHDGLYLRRSRGDLRVEPKETVGNIGAMGKGTTIARTDNDHPLVLGDFVNGYSDYVKQVGMVTELDDVRDFDRFMNMKPSKEQDSVFTLAHKNNDSHVYDLFTDWQKRVTGVSVNKTDKPNALSKTFNAAAGNMISFNPGTWFKELLDPIRMISDVGLRNFAKGTARGLLASVDPNTRETYRAMANSNAFYQAMNLDNWVVSENTIGATTSRWSRKVSVFTQGFENYMYKYLATPVYEQYVLSQHPNDPDYYVGSPKLCAEVTSKFETDSLMYLSNANKLDMSNLRAGAQGTFMKCFFGTFQGNQQKMFELVDSTLTGGSRSKNRQAAYEKGRTSAEQELQEAKTKLDDATKAYESAKNGTLEEGVDEVKVFNDYDSAKMKYESLQNTVKDYDNLINTELTYQKGTPKRIGAFVGSMVALAAGDVLISYLNSVARGSKELNKEDFLSKDNAEQLGLDMFTSWIPYVNVITSAFQYSSDLTAPQTQGLTDSVDAVKAMVKAVSGTGTGYNAFLKSLDALSSVSGVPVSSVLKYFSGAVKNIGEWSGNESMYKLYTKMNGYNSTYLSKQMSDSLSRNNLTEATTELKSSMALFKTGAVSHNTARELARLYGEGYNAIPKDYPTKDGKAGNEHFRDIYSESNTAVSEMMNQRVYSVLDDSDRAKAVKKVYDAYYETANASVQTDTEEGTPSKARTMIEGGMGNGLLGRIVLGSYYAKGMSSDQRYSALVSSGYSSDEALLVIWYLGGSVPEGKETRLETLKKRYSLS